MRALRNPGEGLSEFTLPKNALLHLKLMQFSDFEKREKELAHNLLYCIGVVNRDSLNSDGLPMISYSIN